MNPGFREDSRISIEEVADYTYGTVKMSMMSHHSEIKNILMCLLPLLLPHQAKAMEPLNHFYFAIEKRHPSKYSSAVAKKEERGK